MCVTLFLMESCRGTSWTGPSCLVAPCTGIKRYCYHDAQYFPCRHAATCRCCRRGRCRQRRLTAARLTPQASWSCSLDGYSGLGCVEPSLRVPFQHALAEQHVLQAAGALHQLYQPPADVHFPTRTQVDRNVGTKHRNCTSTAEAPNLLHVLYIFFMFCKSNVDMFLHSKLSAHESESPFVVHVAYDISKRSPQRVLESDCAYALVASVASLPLTLFGPLYMRPFE